MIDRNAVAAHIDNIIEELGQLKSVLTFTGDIASVPAIDGPPPPDPYPWVAQAQRYIGLDEIDDKEELMDLFDRAGIVIDPEDTPWCGAFVNAVLHECGVKGVDSLRARDFADWGQESVDAYGAIAVFRSHVGFVSKEGYIIGGNQSNSVCEHKQDYYKNLIGYRIPHPEDTI